jgi:type II restriction enzyme
MYDSVVLSDPPSKPLDIEIQRRHAQIQVALLCIGRQLGFQTWIAQNDKGILYQQKRLCEHEGVVSDLRNIRLLESWKEAIQAARLIDCIWFQNCKLMPAVMEVEHSTGVKNGLLRMQKFKDALPRFPSRWVIVAPDEDRDRVMRESHAPQFSSLEPLFFPYSAVEELYSLCSRRKLQGVTEEFLDSFMEKTVA